MTIYVYMTIACINDWKTVIDNIYTQLKTSPLYQKIKKIRCCVHVNPRDRQHLSYTFFRDSKVEIMKVYAASDNSFEKKTCDLLWEHSQTEEFYVLYLHSKGVSDRHQNEESRRNIKAWTDYMLHYNIRYHSYILDHLHEYDAIGTNLNGHSNLHYRSKYSSLKDYMEKNGPIMTGVDLPLHFSGNFWWSKSSYIRQIAKCDPLYPGSEIWICNGDSGRMGRFLSMHNAHAWFYGTCYDKKEYVDVGLHEKYERRN